MPRTGKSIERKSRLAVARCWVLGYEGEGRRNGEELLNGYKVSFSDDEDILELDGADGCTTHEFSHAPEF